jgi:hypothetical protein
LIEFLDEYFPDVARSGVRTSVPGGASRRDRE